MLPAGYDNNVQIFQAPGYVILAVEMVHDVRIVPLDGRPHLPPHIRQWLGDSRGHWEGNALVVGTTNFTDKIGSFSTTRVSWGTGRRSWAGAVLRAARAAGPRAPVRVDPGQALSRCPSATPPTATVLFRKRRRDVDIAVPFDALWARHIGDIIVVAESGADVERVCDRSTSPLQC